MDLIDRVIKQILGASPALKQGLQDAKIMEAWPLAVGGALAKHTRAVQVRGKTLLIEVDHPIWKQELHSNKQLALRRLNEKLSSLFDEQKVFIEDLFLLSKSPTRTKPE